MFSKSRREIEYLKQKYTKGTILEVIDMEDPQAVPSGTRGEVYHVDDIGQIHVNWENGSGLALVVGVDKFKIIK